MPDPKAPESVKQSVEHLKKSAHATERSADQATTLAADRTVLATERTYAAWIRTGLAALASGVGAKAVSNDVMTPWLINAMSSLLVIFSALCFIASIWRGSGNGAPLPVPNIKRLPRALLLTVNGALLLVSLVALVGIWMVS